MRTDLGFSDVLIGLLQGLSFAIAYSLVGIPVGKFHGTGECPAC
jgi:hypothetical protein